ncbi:MAG: hypothetical protein ACKVOR_14060 [Flavobacteriales bacterium]
MKRMIVFAIAALPLFAMAQDKKEPVPTTSATKTNDKPAITNPETIFMELIVSQGPVGSVIKADIGRDIVSSLTDKELVKQLSELRTMSFSSMPDAMNYLASIGFKYVSTYVTYDKEGKADSHLVFEKRLSKRPPAEGGTKPAKPEKPDAGSKPSLETKPTEKKPAVKEEKK